MTFISDAKGRACDVRFSLYFFPTKIVEIKKYVYLFGALGSNMGTKPPKWLKKPKLAIFCDILRNSILLPTSNYKPIIMNFNTNDAT